MRTRRSFQPTLDSMPNRIAPSGWNAQGRGRTGDRPQLWNNRGRGHTGDPTFGHGVQPMDTTDPTNTAHRGWLDPDHHPADHPSHNADLLSGTASTHGLEA